MYNERGLDLMDERSVMQVLEKNGFLPIIEFY